MFLLSSYHFAGVYIYIHLQSIYSTYILLYFFFRLTTSLKCILIFTYNLYTLYISLYISSFDLPLRWSVFRSKNVRRGKRASLWKPLRYINITVPVHPRVFIFIGGGISHEGIKGKVLGTFDCRPGRVQRSESSRSHASTSGVRKSGAPVTRHAQHASSVRRTRRVERVTLTFERCRVPERVF